MSSHESLSTESDNESSDSSECEFMSVKECQQCTIYKKRISELEKILKKSARETSTEESAEGVLDMSDKRIEDLVEKYYTEDLFFQGQKGIVSFIYSYIIRDDDNRSKILYRCVDQTKKIFQFQSDEGIQKDARCKTLLDVVYDPLIKKVNKVYRIIINRIYEEDEKNSTDSDIEDEEDYDSDIEEVITEELHFCDSDENKSSVDDRVNIAVNKFLENKKCCNKNRKPVIDELSQLLYI